MKIDVLFPTLIGISQADPQTIAAIDAEILGQEEILKQALGPTWGDNVLSSFNAHKHIFQSAHLAALQKFVETSVLEFAAKTTHASSYVFDEDYTQSWLNVTRKFGFQERHNHERPAAGLPISGAYYFRTNEQDGDLAIFPSDMQYKQYENHVIPPCIGKLVLFRSEVFHRVSANMTDSDRISFSFNYLLKAV
jgi:Rps23 Pro-64 3,4-dihydroxylase Tpa1-like proline 4-hydroxylase